MDEGTGQACLVLPLPVAVARLRTAAGVLSGSALNNGDSDRVARMLALDPAAWTPGLVEAAAVVVACYPQLLTARGVDPALLPKPHQPAPSPRHPTPSQPGAAAPVGERDARVAAAFTEAAALDQQKAADAHAAATAPFEFDGSLDGLRGIPVTELAAVTDKAWERWEGGGLSSLYDLLMHIPLRYVDRTAVTPIAALTVGQPGTVIGTVDTARVDTARTGARLAKVTVKDATGRIECVWFQSPWQAKRVKRGDEVLVQGTLSARETPNGKRFVSMQQPLMDVIGDRTAWLLPIYPQSGETITSGDGTKVWKATLTTWQIHRAAMEAVARLGATLTDPVPGDVIARRGLMGRALAYRQVHHPSAVGDEKKGRDRLAYDELLAMQLAYGMRRASAATAPGHAHAITGTLTGGLTASLPYALTGAQQRATTAIAEHMKAAHPMNVLLQGDVGAGKTLVATLTLLMAVEAGGQGALMAPTEILATQLHAELTARLSGLTKADGQPITVGLVTNRVRSKARRETLARLADGTLDLIVGTHALLSDDVAFHNLTAVVIDEQHRFGVEQRAALRDKATITPDVMVMTATPIPRTAAMTVFGDLDLIVLDELPPGRTPITTTWVPTLVDPSDPFDPVWDTVRAHAASGHQTYVVCPLVEDSETRAAANANDTAAQLREHGLHGLSVGVVHGKMDPNERAATMGEFAAGRLDVLVATTVIEVGVNVPNATCIVILDPGSFGIAQLHQLRGRVGRGAHASQCILAGQVTSDTGVERMTVLCASTDGFVLAEKDLQLRGAGEVFGARQSGLSDLRVASLTGDPELMLAAREDAKELLAGDPGLLRRPGLRNEVVAAIGPDAADWLTRS